MIKTILLLLFVAFSTISLGQYYTATEITSIHLGKTAGEGDMYLDTANDNYYIGLTNGELSKLGMDSARVTDIFYTILDTINGSIFPVFAEESSGLSSGRFQWSYGNGDDSQAEFGIVLPMNVQLFAIGLNVLSGSGEVEVYKNGVATGLTSGSASPVALNNSFSPITFSAGDIINFRTVVASGAGSGGKAVAWFRVSSTKIPFKRIYGGSVPTTTIGNNGDEYLNTSNADLYSKELGVWVLQTNLRGISGSSSLKSYIQVSNTLSGNINNGTTVYDWIETSNSTHITNDAANFVVATDGITVNKTATYKVTIYQYQISFSERTNPVILITNNGTNQSGFGANAYIRDISGHNESTASISMLVSAVAGDKIGFVNKAQAQSGSVTCPAESLVFMIEEM